MFEFFRIGGLGPMDQPDGWMDVPDGWMDPPDGWVDPPDGWVDPPDGWMDQPDGWMDRVYPSGHSAIRHLRQHWHQAIRHLKRPTRILQELLGTLGRHRVFFRNS